MSRARRGERRRDWVVGVNSVLAVLESGSRKAYKLLISRGEKDRNTENIIKVAEGMGIQVDYTDRRYIEEQTGTYPHQGIALLVERFRFTDIETIVEISKRDKSPIVVLDGVEDPRNLGAIIRTSEAIGASGLIIRKARQSPITTVVAKSAEGALEYLPISQVPNLAGALRKMKDEGIWAVCLEEDASDDIRDVDIPSPFILIAGSEGRGVSRLLYELSDFSVRIPITGRTPSLNVNVAVGIALFYLNKV